MNQHDFQRFTAFDGNRRIASGQLDQVALAVKQACEHDAQRLILIYDDSTGRAIDIDTRGSNAEILSRLGFDQIPLKTPNNAPSTELIEEPRGRGRPKLGVVAREVTLLPRHWEWLNAQSGGASVVLRRLVEEARRASADTNRAQQTRDAAYHFMSSIAGDWPGFEEASRALFANDRVRFSGCIANWPEDIRDHLHRLLASASSETPAPSC